MNTPVKIVLVALGGLATYVVYRNYLASDAGSSANASLGGIDFGVLDPSTW
jgi:hypothetical protein